MDTAFSDEVLLREVGKLPHSLNVLCKIVLADLRFATGFGGASHHHNWRGGLKEHTAEVVAYSLQMAGPSINTDVLVTAAVWHDYHKIYEYDMQDGKIIRLPYAKLVGHVAGSANEFMCRSEHYGVDPEIRGQIYHCMLSHHGRREWGSPVGPQTREAFILHSADMLSMQGGKR